MNAVKVISKVTTPSLSLNSNEEIVAFGSQRVPLFPASQLPPDLVPKLYRKLVVVLVLIVALFAVYRFTRRAPGSTTEG